MPTLFSQPMIRVPQSPWKVWPRHWLSQEWKSSWLGFRELNATLWKKGGPYTFESRRRRYLQNPDPVFMDRSMSQSPPVDPLNNGRGDLEPFLSCIIRLSQCCISIIFHPFLDRPQSLFYFVVKLARLILFNDIRWEGGGGQQGHKTKVKVEKGGEWQ